MELTGRYSIHNSLYKRNDSLTSRCDASQWVLVVGAAARSAPPATLLEAQPPDLKIAPRALYKVPPHPLSTPLTPQFFGFSPLFKKFFAPRARHCPPCAESPCRALTPPENPGIPRQNRPFAPRRRPKITRKIPLQNPEKPAPHAPPHKKVELNTLNSIDSPSERVHT